MAAASFEAAQLEEAWIEGDDYARWRSAAGHGPEDGAAGSGSSLLEVGPGHKLPRHTDSAEETVVVLSGEAAVSVEGSELELGSGGIAVIPADAPHEVRNTGTGDLRFAAVYAADQVVTTYEAEVQPDGKRQRRTVG
jgi:quercetin dioxygenase-like cupin family protein